MTTIIKIRNTAWAYALFFFALGLPLCITAQTPQLLTPVTAGGITFERYRLTTDAAISYCNIKYVEAEINANFPPLDFYSPENFSIKIATHDLFLQAVKESFTPERFALLVGRNEELGIHFILSQTGKLLSLAFVLNADSQITPAELAKLEGNMAKRLNFQPYNVNVAGPARKHLHIYFYLREVQIGEVKDVRFYSK